MRRATVASPPRRITIQPGNTFGLWTALEEYSRENRRILVRCRCGTERRLLGEVLTAGKSMSCGCAKKGVRYQRGKPYIATGSTFGRLTVLEDATYATDHVRCRCECGTEKKIPASSVRRGQTRSCGCLFRDSTVKHGLYKNPLYQIWVGIIWRCENPKARGYEGYGLLGVKLHGPWHDVTVFVAEVEREIGPRPEGVDEKGRALYSLDRFPDNGGNYEPGNIRWATAQEQAANRRKVPVLALRLVEMTRQRDDLAVELAALKATLPTRRRSVPALAPDLDGLFPESDIR